VLAVVEDQLTALRPPSEEFRVDMVLKDFMRQYEVKVGCLHETELLRWDFEREFNHSESPPLPAMR
jgi:hypothetical protein